MDAIHIAYALNDKYAEMTCVSMCSVLANSENSEIVFHLFAEQLSSEHVHKLTSVEKWSNNTSVCFHDVQIDNDLFIPAMHNSIGFPNLTKEAYARVLMPDVLSDLSRILYLDCDTIVEENITQLWQADLGDALVGMIADYSLETKTVKKEILEIGESGIYFNTGVILMDIPGLLRFQLSRTVSENIGLLHKKVVKAHQNWYADQDVINYVLRGKIKKLPMCYNSYFWESSLLGENIDDCIKAYANPVVVHFIGTPKPSELSKIPVNVSEWERYYKYKAISPFASDSDSIKTSLYKIHEDNTLNALMPFHLSIVVHCFSTRFAKQMFSFALQKYKMCGNDKKVIVWGLNDRTWTFIVYITAHEFDVNGIVDGVESNQGVSVFDHVVQSPEILRGCAEDTFVMLDMRSFDTAQQIMITLKSWGYTDNDFCHVYSPIWGETRRLGE